MINSKRLCINIQRHFFQTSIPKLYLYHYQNKNMSTKEKDSNTMLLIKPNHYLY